MKNGFEEQVYNAACMAMGEAVWQLVNSGETVTQEAIARKVVELTERQPDIASSTAVSVLRHA